MTRSIRSLLVANRGEIARRVFRTCAELGIARIAVFSDADAESLHVAEADVSVRLPGSAPSETYLRPDLIVGAALAAGADAVHPGYGFLSENAAFARAVVDAGLLWIGPPPEAVEAMGSKVAAKRIMDRAGVPVLPELDPSQITQSDLPVLVKASAGGGGRGMRVVRSLDALADAVADARAEAAAAFGDPTVFCERFIEAGRHIEVQILADRYGTGWTLGERECSIQRRHQKVVEETPSPFVDDELRTRLFDAARTAAKAIDYVGAGTVEFLVAHDGRFSFLEMNTRLQVEHPVTECVTGLDLVALQIRVAEGHRLPAEPPPPHGHAIEARLYAEDPAADWRPQSGMLRRFEIPGAHVGFAVLGASGIRLDSAVTHGSSIGTHYDPMLAKVIAWAPDRAAAARRLAAALAAAKIHGLRTNRDMLVNILRHDAFLAGHTDTAFLERHRAQTVAEPLADDEAHRVCAIAAALAQAAANRRDARVAARLPSGWRNVPSAPQRRRYRCGEAEHEVAYHTIRSRQVVLGAEDIEVVEAAPDRVVLEISGLCRTFDVARYPGLVCVDSSLGPVALVPVPRFTEPGRALAAGSLTAQMPGTVLRIAVTVGQSVAAGEPLLWLEAMKMQHVVAAPTDGQVTDLPVAVGQQVDQGAVLAVITTRE
ncbi:MAG TPA: biotin carboxylase N-terminal domain-containing protein [Actinocrinis sp.]|uniref:acetyl/propionyl/methylcrotonyl-CoA carboxylase subunit alpha n=1 Tax=Actinocrinis sp. TaxID=1920516 RepID=UPI002DDC9ACD|nr:biotin carboxylase N-terminal domain-containing protein [Actinocrinis sp.]HEV2346855.1 biotin carboxylase N-terminal domain-containing protein [Actinocrinis sp.]